MHSAYIKKFNGAQSNSGVSNIHKACKPQSIPDHVVYTLGCSPVSIYFILLIRHATPSGVGGNCWIQPATSLKITYMVATNKKVKLCIWLPRRKRLDISGLILQGGHPRSNLTGTTRWQHWLVWKCLQSLPRRTVRQEPARFPRASTYKTTATSPTPCNKSVVKSNY